MADTIESAKTENKSKLEPDHEFPWIMVNMEKHYMTCTVCNVAGITDEWLRFLAEHQYCWTLGEL